MASLDNNDNNTQKNNSVGEEIIAYIADLKNINRAEISMQSSITKDLALDSLDIADLIAESEKKFKIELLDDEVSQIDTIKEIVDIVEKKIKVSEL